MDIYGRKYYDFRVRSFIFSHCNHFMPNSKENFFPRVGRPGQNVKTKDKKEMDKRALEEKRQKKDPAPSVTVIQKDQKMRLVIQEDNVIVSQPFKD